MIKKTKRHEDKKWLLEQRKHPCLFTGKTDVEVAHIRNGSNAGTGRKPDDYYTVPIAWSIHREEHQHGSVRTFLKYFGMYPLSLFSVVRAYARLQYVCYLVATGREDEAIDLLRE